MSDTLISPEQIKRTKDLLWQTVLPIIVENEDGSMEVVGTGFVIRANGRQATLVTAGHVVSHIQKLERPNSRANPSTPPFFLAPEYRFELHRVKPFALYRHPTRGNCRVLIEACLELKQTDLALCSIRFNEISQSNMEFDAAMALDTRPVERGEKICALGYALAEMQSNGAGIWSYSAEWRQVSGTVAQTSPELKLPGLTTDRFQCDAEFEHGLSGGPVCSAGPDNTIVVRGVVSSGDQASMIWQILLMPVSVPRPDGNIVGRTLLDLEREGLIVDRGRGSEHVSVTRDLRGQVSSAGWQ